jgi:hypothetical protein
MYFHGLAYKNKEESDGLERLFPEARRWMGLQRTKLAVSRDGIHFVARPEILGSSYFRVFQWEGKYYALGMPGILYASLSGLDNFKRGPAIFSESMRHAAVFVHGNILYVLYSNAGDCPERILYCSLDPTEDWMEWKPSESKTLIEPEFDYEGVHLPLEPSDRGLAVKPVRQLRDPAVFEDAGKRYILYTVAGEQGIAMALLEDV